MDQRTLLILFSCIFLMTACKEETPSLPIAEDKMVEVLADVHLAEAALQSLYGAEKDSMARLYYQQIYVIHDIEEEQFEQSLRHLRRDPETAEQLYTLVMEELSKREAEVTE